jgi:hypothetical protein
MLDLDKRRAERDDVALGVTLDGDEWELPARLPLVVSEDLANGRLRAVIAGTFGAKAAADARKGKTGAAAQVAADHAVAPIVDRLGPLLDDDIMSELFAELYDMGEKPKKKQRKEPQDHLPKS